MPDPDHTTDTARHWFVPSTADPCLCEKCGEHTSWHRPNVYIATYQWHGLRRWTAMDRLIALGPVRANFLVALSDAHRKGVKPEWICKDDGAFVAADQWEQIE